MRGLDAYEYAFVCDVLVPRRTGSMDVTDLQKDACNRLLEQGRLRIDWWKPGCGMLKITPAGLEAKRLYEATQASEGIAR